MGWAKGRVLELDTSEDYFGSHEAISNHSGYFKITTKLDLNKELNSKNIEERVLKIAGDLKREKLDRILIRPHATDPVATIRAINELQTLQMSRVLEEFGLTIYDTDELEFFTRSIDFPITFQVPLNLLNRKFEYAIKSNEELYKQKKFYVRSIFLQGLLLMKPDEIPNHLKDCQASIEVLAKELANTGSSILEATFAFLKDQEWISGVVVGIRNLAELKQNIEAFSHASSVDWDFLKNVPKPDSRILDPRLW